MATPTTERVVSVLSPGRDERRDSDGQRWSRVALGRRLGSELLGASVYVLAPGSGTWPYHAHLANEELLLVLAGSATVRTPDGEVRVATGDAITFSRGPAGSHAVRNDGDGPCRIVIVSTMVEPEVAHFPDDDSYVVFAGAPPVPGETAPVERRLVPPGD